MFSALVLAIPTALTVFFMAQPGTSYTTFMVVAGIAGLGGGNFASSMTNINAFYPQRYKGWALGLNAGGGNIGVAMIQIVGLLVIATVGNRSPQWVCAVYLVLLSIAAIGAALFMDNLTNQRTNGRSMIDVMRYRDSWLIALLYIGTFGSFIGFSFAFGQVLQISFLANLSHGAKVTPAMTAQASLHAAQIAFIGPLLGSIARPPGGWLSDRIGGSRVTLYTFAAMIAAAGWLVVSGEIGDATHRAPYRRHPDRLRGRVRRAVHPVGGRQRRGVQDDPVDLRSQGPGHGRAQPCGEGRLVAPNVRRADRDRRSHRSAWRRWHQRRAAGVVPVGREVGDHGVLGLPGLLRAVRGDHLVRVRSHAEQDARRYARDGRRGQLGGGGRGVTSAHQSVVVVGHGMVGHRFVEALRDRDLDDRWHITVLCDEPTPAYDRVALSSYVDSWDRGVLALPGNDYAGDDLVHLRVAERVTAISRAARTVTTSTGARIGYDALVLATGSYPFVPPIPGKDSDRCFVYRTLDDLDAIRVVAEAAGPGAAGIVVGGGLLGLEAANALRLMGLTPHVVELASAADAASSRPGRWRGAGRHRQAAGSDRAHRCVDY